ncbi:MAG: DHH family phosphoesterase [archaeon]
MQKNFSIIDDSDIGKSYTIPCIIEKIRQTSGPTVFSLNDGFGIFKATAFVKPGERAFMQLAPGDSINATIAIKKRKDDLEGELLEAEPLTKDEIAKLMKTIGNKTDPCDVPFLIKADILDKLRPKMLDAAKIIRTAIFSQTLIILKHHADCDGYCSGVALERAIMPLIEENSKSGSNTSFYFRRSPCKTPFYEYSDVLRDISTVIELNESGKKPLFILSDLGAVEENLDAIKRLRIHDATIVVIDHHNPDGAENIKKMEENCDIYINPYCEGFDSSLVCGMICTELARLINKDAKNIEFLPALAGTGDKSNKNEFDQYLKISGYDPEYLKKFAICVDFETHYIKYMEGRMLVDELFCANKARHEKLIELLYCNVEKKMNTLKVAVQKYMEVTNIDNLKLIKIDCEKVTSQGEFPNSSKIVRIAHELYSGPRITIGLHSDAIIFRVDSVKNFNVNDLVSRLQKLKPHAVIEGGGHEFAGTLSFLPAAKIEIITYVERYILFLKQKRF